MTPANESQREREGEDESKVTQQRAKERIAKRGNERGPAVPSCVRSFASLPPFNWLAAAASIAYHQGSFLMNKKKNVTNRDIDQKDEKKKLKGLCSLANGYYYSF